MDNQLYTSRSIGDIATLAGAGAAKGFLNARYESVREAHEWFMKTLPSKVSASGVSEGTTLPQRTTTTDYYYYRRLLLPMVVSGWRSGGCPLRGAERLYSSKAVQPSLTLNLTLSTNRNL